MMHELWIASQEALHNMLLTLIWGGVVIAIVAIFTYGKGDK